MAKINEFNEGDMIMWYDYYARTIIIGRLEKVTEKTYIVRIQNGLEARRRKYLNPYTFVVSYNKEKFNKVQKILNERNKIYDEKTKEAMEEFGNDN